MINQIYHCKWEELVPKIPNNEIDIIITSPPYNVSLGSNKLNKNKYKEYEDNLPYNEYLIWMDSLFSECYRILKPGGRICINIGDGANGAIPTHADFTIRMRDIHKFTMMTTILWNKNQVGARTAWGSFQSPSCPSFPTPFEFIIVMAKECKKHDGDKDKITITKEEFIKNSNSLWTFTPETKTMKKYGHPAAYPEELPRRLINHLTYKDDIVFDPFSGTGTTCCVAKLMGRRFIGCEMTEQYFNVSIDRLKECHIDTKWMD